MLPLTVIGTGSAGFFAVDQPLHKLGSGGYKTTAKIATGLSGGKVQVLCPPLATVASSAIASLKYRASAVQAVLQSSNVYHDDPFVRVSMQVSENTTMGTHTLQRLVHVQVSTSTASAPANVKVMCGGSASGVCVANVNVGGLFKGLKASVSGAVKFGFDGTPLRALGNVRITKLGTKITENVVDTVYATLPEKPLFPGDIFAVEVKSTFRQYLKTAGVQIKLGAGLKFVSNSQYPRFPKQQNGQDVFSSTKIDGDAQKVYGIVAGRKDGQSAKTLDSPTDETIFAVLVQVLASVKDGGAASVEISKLDQLTDLKEAPLKPARKGVLEGRAGVANPAQVHFKTNQVVGLFATAGGPTELLNTAVISGLAIKTKITATAIHTRSQPTTLDSELKCSTANSSVITLASCTVTLTGKEKHGGRASVVLAYTGLKQVAHFRVHYPTKVSLRSNIAAIRPIAGLLDPNDKNCTRLRYQNALITGKAAFSDGDSTFSDYDISAIIKLEAKQQNLVTIQKQITHNAVSTNGKMVQTGGVTVDLLAKSPTGVVLAAIKLNITDQQRASRIAVIGLDTTVAAKLGALTFSGQSPHPRNTESTVFLAKPQTRELKFKDDAMFVLVSAVLEDHTRVPLDIATGLVIQPYNPKSLLVKKQSLVVPLNGEAGAVVRVAWEPKFGSCSNVSKGLGTYASRNITLRVVPPLATAILATVSNAFIVCVGDPAAAPGASYPSVDQIKVSLKFPGNRIVQNLAGDKRTIYRNNNPGLFSVSTQGRIVANANSTTGAGTVTVRFVGQNVTTNVSVTVARMATLSVRATPYPSYPGSERHKANVLNRIACSNPKQYQQAQLVVTISLTNKASKTIATRFLKFVVAKNGFAVKNDLISPNAVAKVNCFCQTKAYIISDGHCC